MQPTVAPSTRSAFGICLVLALACATERQTPGAASSTSATIAAKGTDSTSAMVDSSRLEIEIDSLALRAPIPIGYPPAKEPRCPDSVDVFECYSLKVEKPILSTTGPRVRRTGDTLRINTNARTLRWINTEMTGEGAERHFYEGTITVLGGKKYAVVRHSRYEDIPYVLIDWISGDTLVVPDRPVVSPDFSRIVAGEFSEDGRLELEVWNLALEPPKREFAHEWDGAGPVNIAWRDNRPIDFRLRQTSGGRESVPTPSRMTLTREDSTWTLAIRH
jgi:hypothetical protein